jgi:hypothetical protein
MSIKRNLFIGAAITVLATGGLLSAARGFSRKSQADWDAERWIRLLSGSNDIFHSQGNSTLATRNIQTGRTGYQVNIGGLQAYHKSR